MFSKPFSCVPLDDTADTGSGAWLCPNCGHAAFLANETFMAVWFAAESWLRMQI